MIVSWLAWRTGKNFGAWHRTYDGQWTICGKQPNGIVSTRVRAPKPKDECRTCYLNDRGDLSLSPKGTA